MCDVVPSSLTSHSPLFVLASEKGASQMKARLTKRAVNYRKLQLIRHVMTSWRELHCTLDMPCNAHA